LLFAGEIAVGIHAMTRFDQIRSRPAVTALQMLDRMRINQLLESVEQIILVFDPLAFESNDEVYFTVEVPGILALRALAILEVRLQKRAMTILALASGLGLLVPKPLHQDRRTIVVPNGDLISNPTKINMPHQNGNVDPIPLEMFFVSAGRFPAFPIPGHKDISSQTKTVTILGYACHHEFFGCH
jgi:hypothetical protein